MNVLLVSHNYLPVHSAGTEVYTAQLARHLIGRGHGVSVFCAEKDISLPDLSLRERTHEGVAVTELINNLYHEDFRGTWDQPRIAQLFGQHLDRSRPDVVHFQHLLYLSIGCVEEAARRGLGIVFTLHDYWLHCARFGQRVHVDGTLCEVIDHGRCGDCLASFKFSQSGLERRAGKLIAGVRGATGLDLGRAARGAARALTPVAGAGRGGGESPDAELVRVRTGEVAERERAMRERVLPHVHRFLAPSRFLRERFLEWGIPPERIEHQPTGLDPESFPLERPARRAHAERGGDHPLRVAFLGSLVPLKGAHVLLEAWAQLPADVRARGKLELFGPSHHHPDYQQVLRPLAERAGAWMAGPVPRADVPRLLAEIDLVVVPSTWYENAPLVILEALALGTPVLVSDIGGMAELVDDGRTGFHFRVGDAADLAAVLQRVLEDPSKLDALFQDAPPMRSAVEDAVAVEGVYLGALDAARGEA